MVVTEYGIAYAVHLFQYFNESDTVKAVNKIANIESRQSPILNKKATKAEQHNISNMIIDLLNVFISIPFIADVFIYINYSFNNMLCL